MNSIERNDTHESLLQKAGVLEEAIKRNAPEYAVERRCDRLERWIDLRVARSGLPSGELGRFSHSLRTYLVREVLQTWDEWRTPGPSTGLTLSEVVYGVPGGALGFRTARQAYDATHAELLRALEARRRNEIEPMPVEPVHQPPSSVRISAMAALALLFGLMLGPIDGGRFHDNYRSVIFAASLSAIFGYAIGTRERKH
ncbi:hypothetical protein HY493_00175 [Candidatus Woesearchaeota archaeon]|nr:hypothetical protein [Candidatus Woesearchaeota archaeon]